MSLLTYPAMTDHKEVEVAGLDEANHRSSESSTVGSPPQSRVDEAKLLRKIDWHLLPILFAVYVVAFLDRQVVPWSVSLGVTASDCWQCQYFKCPYDEPANRAWPRW